MSLYRVRHHERALERFRSTALSEQFLEQDLESWIESNPGVLLSDEPLLVIGRQVNTPVGVVDLLALDGEGAVVVIELKRAPSQREAVSQVLEYGAWASQLDVSSLRQQAEAYFSKQGGGGNLEQRWTETFSTDLAAVRVSELQRLIVVAEGQDPRLEAVVRFLRQRGVEISLLGYNFYRTDNGEQILDFNRVVGEEDVQEASIAARKRFTEPEVLAAWQPELQAVYSAIRDPLYNAGLQPKPKKASISFEKLTREGPVFVCTVEPRGEDLAVWLRSDSLRARFDFAAAASEMERALPKDVRIKHTPTWFIASFAATKERAGQVASAVLEYVVPALE